MLSVYWPGNDLGRGQAVLLKRPRKCHLGNLLGAATKGEEGWWLLREGSAHGAGRCKGPEAAGRLQGADPGAVQPSVANSP